MTDIQGHHADGCLMCAVRALTEGRAKEWSGTEEPDEITGVVLRQGSQPTHFSNDPVPFIELWLGGQNRMRVTGHSSILASLISNAETQVGDTVTVKYLGKRDSTVLRNGKTYQYKAFELKVERGH